MISHLLHTTGISFLFLRHLPFFIYFFNFVFNIMVAFQIIIIIWNILNIFQFIFKVLSFSYIFFSALLTIENCKSSDFISNQLPFQLIVEKSVSTAKLPNSDHPKQQTSLKQRTNFLVPNAKIFVKLPPNRGHLSITDKFCKTRRCPLFRGFTVLSSIISFWIKFLKLFVNVSSLINELLNFERPGPGLNYNWKQTEE